MTSSESSTLSPRVSNRFIEALAVILLISGVIVALIGIVAFSWQQQRFVTDVKADTSLLGNMGSFLSGTVGVTWSLASVILFYLALKEQRRDIKISQNALTLQIKELEDTRKVYTEQSDTLRTQRFENTFFQLLQLHTNATNDLIYSTSNQKAVFDRWKFQLCYIMKGRTAPYTEDEYGGIIAGITTPFEDKSDVQTYLKEHHYYWAYRDFENTLNHYFTQLYHIFKYVHLSDLISNDAKSFYSSLIRARLSQNELHALVFNCLFEDYGYPKFMFLVREYDIVQNYNHKDIECPIVWEYFKEVRDSVSNPFVNQ